MSSSVYIIAARFHGTILGLAAEKSVFPILYSDKTKYVLEDLEEKIQKNTGELMGEYYRKVKDEYLQFAGKEGCEQ